MTNTISKQNAAIFILTQNTDVRRTYLKTCLYFLNKNFNETYQYPILIYHEGDYDAKSQREVIMSVRRSCRSLVSFVELDPEDFQIPAHIDKEKMAKCIATRPVPYWRNAKYRMMCRWWLLNWQKYATGYDYIMRIDDDSIIEEPVQRDLFAWMAEKDLNYASNFVHVDCAVCCFKMKELFEKQFPNRTEEIRKCFVKQEIPLRAVQFQPLLQLLSIIEPKKPGDQELPETMTLYGPIMMYNNFFITKTAFWSQPEVKDLIQKIDEDGGLFYLRYGDSPLQSLICMLLSPPEKISRSIFKYSKRLQREAFEDDNGEFHSYMPEDYSKSSCMVADGSIKL